MTDLCKELASRARIAAYVLGDGCQYRLFWLHERAEDAVIAECARRGFKRCGVIGLIDGVGIKMVSVYGCESLMESARDDFYLVMMQRGISN